MQRFPISCASQHRQALKPRRGGLFIDANILKTISFCFSAARVCTGGTALNTGVIWLRRIESTAAPRR